MDIDLRDEKTLDAIHDAAENVMRDSTVDTEFRVACLDALIAMLKLKIILGKNTGGK